MAIEIIAEVAQGYEGNPKLAELLALGAVRAGADAIKFQLVYGDELAVATYPYYELFRSLEMGDRVWDSVVNIVKDGGKKLYFDIYGDYSFTQAKVFGADGVKISTTDFYNADLIDKAVSQFSKVFISIGGVPLEELDELASRYANASNIVLMYGFQAEPTPIEENNLLKIASYKERYSQFPIGFMDHSCGDGDEAIYLPLMAAALGVSSIEKHITLDRVLQIEDYVSALEPSRFARFAQVIRSMERALGTSELALTEMEKEYKAKAGKVVVAKRALEPDRPLQMNDLAMKRVSTDGSPDCFRKPAELLGRRLSRPVAIDQPIRRGDLA